MPSSPNSNLTLKSSDNGVITKGKNYRVATPLQRDNLDMKNELRLDPLTGRWVVVAYERSARPSSFLDRDTNIQKGSIIECPFCPGHEEDTPPALETYSEQGHWLLRVVPNKYPAFVGNEPMVAITKGPVFTTAPASGIHEVIVLSPDHNLGWSDLPNDQVKLVMRGIRDRINAHSDSHVVRYSQAIVNSGREAGASLEHPHGQLLATSFVPREITDELAGFSRFLGGCVLCATMEAEAAVDDRIVLEDSETVTISPFWASQPYELLIIPKNHQEHIHKASENELDSIALSVKTTLLSLREHLGDIAYNLVFHSSPYREHGRFHWHVHIVPKLTTRAGFELGTGVMINIVPPEKAASELKAILSRTD
ncbi:MAG: galactose-1-phosphate uridylyltransferase [Actinomycetota bacterium]|nr:galactose-1-phosphate uridylyltransferase [Actinomycetota bacterium]